MRQTPGKQSSTKRPTPSSTKRATAKSTAITPPNHGGTAAPEGRRSVAARSPTTAHSPRHRGASSQAGRAKTTRAACPLRGGAGAKQGSTPANASIAKPRQPPATRATQGGVEGRVEGAPPGPAGVEVPHAREPTVPVEPDAAEGSGPRGLAPATAPTKDSAMNATRLSPSQRRTAAGPWQTNQGARTAGKGLIENG